MKTNNILHNTFQYFRNNPGKILPLVILWSFVFYLVLVAYNVTSNVNRITNQIIENSEITLTFNGRFFSNLGYSDASFPYNFNITDEINDLETLLNEFKQATHVSNVIEIKRMYSAYSFNSLTSKDELELSNQKKQLNIYPYTIPIYGLPENYSMEQLGIQLKEGRHFEAQDYIHNNSIIVNENAGYVVNNEFIPYKVGDTIQLQVFSGNRVTNVSLDTLSDSSISFEVVGIYRYKTIGTDELNSDNYQYNERFYVTDTALTNYLYQWVNANLIFNKENNVNSQNGLRFGQLPLQYGYHQFKLVFNYFPEIEQLTNQIDDQLNVLMQKYTINDDNHLYHVNSSLNTIKDSLHPLLMLSNILIIFTTLLIIIFVLILFISNKFFIKTRSKELAIYRSMGSSNLFTRQLLTEQLIIIIFALPLSISFALVTSNFLLKQITNSNYLYSLLLQQAAQSSTVSVNSFFINMDLQNLILPLLFIITVSILYILIQLKYITTQMNKTNIRTLLTNDD